MNRNYKYISQKELTELKRAKINLIFTLAKEFGLINCYRCRQEIESSDELTVEHKIAWQSIDDPKQQEKLFFDLTNIAFSHMRCNCSAAVAKCGEHSAVGVVPSYGNYNKFIALILLDNKRIYLRWFDDIEEAKIEHDLATVKYLDCKGALNYPEKLPEYKFQIENGWKNQKVEKYLAKLNTQPTCIYN